MPVASIKRMCIFHLKNLISSRSCPKAVQLQHSTAPVDPASVFHYYYYCVYMSFFLKYNIF